MIRFLEPKGTDIEFYDRYLNNTPKSSNDLDNLPTEDKFLDDLKDYDNDFNGDE